MFRLLSVCAMLIACVPTLVHAQDNTPAPRSLELEVAPLRVDCTGVGPMRCLRVRRVPDGTWELWYAPIAGFDFKPGNRYRIRIAGQPVVNPPADGDAMAWRLERIVSQQRAWPQRTRSTPETQ